MGLTQLLMRLLLLSGFPRCRVETEKSASDWSFAVGADRFSLHPARFKIPFNYHGPILQALPATIIMQASLHMGTINVLAVFECDRVAFIISFRGRVSGVMHILAEKQNNLISVDEYLAGEVMAETKRELIDGYVYAMVGTSGNHDRISGNIYSEFRSHLKNQPCEPFGSDMKVKVGSNFFYPDVIVDCHFDESEPYFTETPVIIVEVLSKTTRRKDRTTKLSNYLTIPSLQEYVMVEQDYVDVEVLGRKEGWFSKHYYMGDEVTFESIGLTTSVEAIYDRVHNEDVLAFLAASLHSKDAEADQ